MSHRFGPRTRLTGAAADARVAQWSQRSLIKSVQRGTITLNSVTSNTATITSVSTGNSVLAFLGWTTTSATTSQAEWLPRLALTNATTVTAFVNTSTATDLVVGFEVIEYWPGVIRSVQRGTIATVAASSGTATITAVTTGKAALTDLGGTMTDTGGVGSNIGGKLILTNSTTVTLNLGNSLTTTWGYQVVEFF